MSGSLKVDCAAGQGINIQTSAAFGTLNGVSAWTIAFYYQFATVPDPAVWSDVFQFSAPSLLVDAFHGDFRIKAFSNTLAKSIPIDTIGHHILVSGRATGPSTIYVDGIPSVTLNDLGALPASNIVANIQWNDGVRAGTFYLRDLAIWGTDALDADAAIALATGADTPDTLGATNYWTLQGPPGAVTAGPPGNVGLVDSIGSANLDSIGGTGTLTYDATEITSNPVVPVLFMTPYVDTTGYFLYVPFYFNSLIPSNGGGPPFGPPTVSTDPIFTVAGTPVVPTRLFSDSYWSMVAYQFSSPVPFGAPVTMAASAGWATMTAGAVGGTSAGGLGSAPMTCINYAGTHSDSPATTPTFKIGYNITSTGSNGVPGQIMRNWARRMGSIDPGYPTLDPWRGPGLVTSFDPNKLPASFTGPSVWGFIDSRPDGNGVDGAGMPGLSGTLMLIHGDATTGVNSDPTTGHVLQIDLIALGVGWTISSPNIVSQGTWDPTWNSGAGAWRRIIKTYTVAWSPSGGNMNPQILVQIARVDGLGGPVNIPIMANGQSELGIFEPDPDDITVPATIPADYLDLFDPLAVSTTWLRRHAGSCTIRWMPNQLFFNTTGSGNFVYPADLDIRKSTDFLACNTTTTFINITRVDPVSTTTPTAVICDYINGDATGTIPVGLTPLRPNGVFVLATTAGPHGIRTKDRFTVGFLPHFSLTAAIDASQTVISLSEVTGVVAGAILQIDGNATTVERVQVVSVSGLDVTVTRGVRGSTGHAKLNGTYVYPQFRVAVSDSAYITLTAAIDATQNVIHVSEVGPINGDTLSFLAVGDILQLGPATTDEQVEILEISGLDLTVVRGAKGTTALAKASGTVVYPCLNRDYGGLNDIFMATSPTQLLLFIFTRATPRNVSRSPTLLHAQTFSTGLCPVFSVKVPDYQGSSTYELCSHATSLIAQGNVDGKCTCWVSIPFMCTDAGITAAVNKMIPDFQATPGMDLIVQVDNEVFNGGFDQGQLCGLLAPVAPNPHAPGTPFFDWYEYLASRQHTFTKVARDAFTAAGLNPDRVIWFHNFGNLNATKEAIAFCQTYGLPIRSLAVSWYADQGNDQAATFLSWLPISTGVLGAAATWDIETARGAMMSNYRAGIRHGVVGAVTLDVFLAQDLSRYNNGISVNGTSTPNANAWMGTPVRGRLCGYEGATTQPLMTRFPGDSFPHVAAWVLAMEYSPPWYWTETDFFKMIQDGSYHYALLMGDLFPDPNDAIMEFGAYFMKTGISFPIGPTTAYTYTTNRWIQQKDGYGDGSHGGVVNRLDWWNPTGMPVSLTGNIDAVQTVIPLSSTADIIPGMFLDIDPILWSSSFETVHVESVAGLNVTVTRGAKGTAAFIQARPSGTAVYLEVVGVGHDMTANGGSLLPTINESVRGQAADDWMTAVAGVPTPAPARRYWGQGIRRS